MPSTEIRLVAASPFAGWAGWSAAQQPPAAQQAFRSAFARGAGATSALMSVRSQHPAPGTQHGEPGAQQSSVQHGEPGTQQSAPGAQQPDEAAGVSQQGEPGMQHTAPGPQQPVRVSARESPTPVSPNRAVSPRITFATIVQSSRNAGRTRLACFGQNLRVRDRPARGREITS
jgi:hypothetical protein